MGNGAKWGILIFVILIVVVIIVLAFIPWGKLGFSTQNCGKCAKSGTYSGSSSCGGKCRCGTACKCGHNCRCGVSSTSTSSSAYSAPVTVQSQTYEYVSPSTSALAEMVEDGSSEMIESSESTYSPQSGYEDSDSEDYGGEDSGTQYSPQSGDCDDSRAMLPDTCSTYDLTNPNVYLYRPQTIIRPLKTRQYQTADVWRGDIPISRDPCKAGCFESQYAQAASLKYDAYFSGMCAPGRRGDVNVVNEGTIMDHQPKRSASGACGSSDYEIIA